MTNVFQEIMRLTAEDPVWVPAVAAGYEFAQMHENHFAGSWIVQKTGWLLNLKRSPAAYPLKPNSRAAAEGAITL